MALLAVSKCPDGTASNSLVLLISYYPEAKLQLKSHLPASNGRPALIRTQRNYEPIEVVAIFRGCIKTKYVTKKNPS